MKALTMRGLAVLALLCFALPRGEAVTITLGPQHTASFLDVTLDISDGVWSNYDDPNRVWHTPNLQGIFTDNWIIGGSFGWDSSGGRFSVVFRDLFFGYQWGADIWWGVQQGSVVPRLGFFGGEKFLQNGTWIGGIPVATRLSSTAVHITWAPVPDGGSTLALLALGLGAVAASARFAIQRRRDIPRPRADRGV